MAMKIKTRKKLLKEYNDKYSNSVTDDIDLLEEYFTLKKLDPAKVLAKSEKLLLNILENRQEITLKIIIYEYPMHTHRARKSFLGGIFSPGAKDNKEYFEKEVKKVLKKSIELINTPAKIVMDAYLEMPDGIPPEEVVLYQAKVLNPIIKPDYDNIGKCYTDMMTDVMYIDDDIVYSGQINKYFNLLPRVEITLSYLTKHESKYIYKKMAARKVIKRLISEDRLTMEILN